MPDVWKLCVKNSLVEIVILRFNANLTQQLVIQMRQTQTEEEENIYELNSELKCFLSN